MTLKDHGNRELEHLLQLFVKKEPQDRFYLQNWVVLNSGSQWNNITLRLLYDFCPVITKFLQLLQFRKSLHYCHKDVKFGIILYERLTSRLLVSGDISMEIVFWLDYQSQQLLLLSYHPVSSPFSSQIFAPISLEISNLTVRWWVILW